MFVRLLQVPCCTLCLGLDVCKALNTFQIEEKYYPGTPTLAGSCANLDDRYALTAISNAFTLLLCDSAI
jgi:hypothetical protein